MLSFFFKKKSTIYYMELVGRLWQIQSTYLNMIYYNKRQTQAKEKERERKEKIEKRGDMDYTFAPFGTTLHEMVIHCQS